MGFLRYEACPKCVDRGKDSRGDNLGIYSDGSKHCYACGYHVFPDSGDRWKAKQDDHKIINVVKGLLPGDYIKEVPNHAWEWLLKFGISADYWRDKIGYSEIRERLIFRVGDPLRFSIGRYTPKGNADSLVRKWHIFGDCHQAAVPVGNGSILVLVEDIISAHKVGCVGHALPLFGTKLYPAHIQYIKKQSKPVILWLDKDQEGTLHSKASNIEVLTGLPCSVLTTDKDPKELSYESITNHIDSHCF